MAIKVWDTFTPAVDTDEYPIVHSSHVKGGYHNVITKDQRDLIPLTRREEGMQVSVAEEGNLVYILDGGLTNQYWKIYTPTLYKKDDPIWNANRIQNKEVDLADLVDGNLIGYNADTDHFESVSITDLIVSTVTTDTIPEGSSHLYFTEDRVRDFVLANPDLFDTGGGTGSGSTLGAGTAYEVTAQQIHEHLNDIRIHVLPIDDTIATDENLWSARKVNDTIRGVFEGDVEIEGNLTIGGSIFELSSNIYKQNITALSKTSTLEKVLQLNPVHYEWKTTGRPDYGFIAEEVEMLFPEFVQDKGTKRVNYSKMVSVLVHALQEMNRELTTVKNQLKLIQKNNRDS